MIGRIWVESRIELVASGCEMDGVDLFISKGDVSIISGTRTEMALVVIIPDRSPYEHASLTPSIDLRLVVYAQREGIESSLQVIPPE